MMTVGRISFKESLRLQSTNFLKTFKLLAFKLSVRLFTFCVCFLSAGDNFGCFIWKHSCCVHFCLMDLLRPVCKCNVRTMSRMNVLCKEMFLCLLSSSSSDFLNSIRCDLD